LLATTTHIRASNTAGAIAISMIHSAALLRCMDISVPPVPSLAEGSILPTDAGLPIASS
jgi:hypothetical protein